MASDSYSSSGSLSISESSDAKDEGKTTTSGRVQPKETVTTKKECCECPCMSEQCKCCEFLRNHFYSAITFKNKIAYFMMIAFSAWMILMALAEKNLLFKVLLTLGFMKLYSFMVKKFCNPSSFNSEAEAAVEKMKKWWSNKCPCQCECMYKKAGMYLLALLFSFLVSGKVYIPILAVMPIIVHWIAPFMELPFVKKMISKMNPYIKKAREAIDGVLVKAKSFMESKTAK